MNKIKVRLISGVMKRFGIPEGMSYKFYERIRDDFKDKDSSWKDKIWSYKRGFLVSTTRAFGLTPENYEHYLSDLDYYRIYPIDKQFRHWIDDKLTMKYILSPFSDYLPKYFCAIRKGGILTPLIDGKDIFQLDDLLDCIKHEKQVALKLASGSAGVGFYKLTYQEHFEIDDNVLTDDQFIEFLKKLDDYLVTEYVVAHEAIRKISGGALNTVRIMVINEDAKHPQIVNSVVKFSTVKSGQVDNISAGGIYANVDIVTGAFSNGKKFVDSFCMDCDHHPDSNIEIKGQLPNWEMMTDKITQISQYLSPLSYLGYDIALTETGFKIIEINSHQGIRMLQTYYPLLKDNLASQFFIGQLKKIKSKKRGFI
jgi:hypothetical protein